MDSGNHSSLTEFILTGLTEKPQFQLPIFPSLPKNLYGHWDGEPGHDHTDWGQFSPAHPHVLFPQLFVLYWSLSVHCHYPQMLVNSVREKKYLLPWMHDSALLCLLKWHMKAMLPSVTPCFIMPSCLIIGASSSQQQFTSCESFNQHSILALCWDSISSRPMWLTIISVIFFHSWSHHVLAFISMN